MTKKEVGVETSRRRLPDERSGFVHRFEIEGKHKGFIIVGLYDDNTPGEIFIQISKEGSTLSGLLDTLAISTSMHFQSGFPLKSMVSKFVNMRFEPSGRTNNPCIPECASIVDYIFRLLGMKFLTLEELREIGIKTACDECGKVVTCGKGTYACTSPEVRT